MAKPKKVRRVEIPSPVLLMLPDGRVAKRHNGEPHLMTMGEFNDAYPLADATPFGNGPRGLRRVLKLGGMFQDAQTGASVDVALDDYDVTMEALNKIPFTVSYVGKQCMPFIEAWEQAELVELPAADVPAAE